MIDDFEAEDDLRTLMRAKEIEASDGRMNRAKAHALEKQEHFRRIASDLPGRSSFTNNAVRGSKMRPK